MSEVLRIKTYVLIRIAAIPQIRVLTDVYKPLLLPSLEILNSYRIGTAI